MLVTSIYAAYNEALLKGKELDFFEIEWYESDKRILRKKTGKGVDIAIKRTIPIQPLLNNDILVYEEKRAVLEISLNLL